MPEQTTDDGVSTAGETAASLPPLQNVPVTPKRPVDGMALPSIEFASNYPRQGRTIFGSTRTPGIYWDSIFTAISMISSNVWTYAFAGSVSSAIWIAAYSLRVLVAYKGFEIGDSAGFRLISILPQAVTSFLIVWPILGLTVMGVRHSLRGTPQITDFFMPFQRPKVSIPAALLAAAPSIAVTCVLRVVQAIFAPQPAVAAELGLFLIPVSALIYISFVGQLLLGGTATVLTGRSPLETAGAVYSRMGSHVFMFGLLFVVSLLVSCTGGVLAGIGFLVTCPVFANVIALHYVYNFPEEQRGYEAKSTDLA